jgi:hypothetical protein
MNIPALMKRTRNEDNEFNRLQTAFRIHQLAGQRPSDWSVAQRSVPEDGMYRDHLPANAGYGIMIIAYLGQIISAGGV